MLEANLPIGTKCPVPVPSSIHEPAVAPFPPPIQSVTDLSQRFYRTVDSVEQPRSPAPDSPGQPTPTNPLQETRLGALDTLTLCRNVITTLELTRLRKSRIGLYNWIGFWERLYERPFANSLASRVSTALSKIDMLFRVVSHDLHQLTQRTEDAIISATSEREILHLLERMEVDVGSRRLRRRRKAQAILNKMRTELEMIPVKVGDDLFDDMKRSVFGLDVVCDYHPGDSVAEAHETNWPDHFIGHPVGYTQESAASGAFMPLSSYTANELVG
ncbi:hypothetical protein P170DRAFT_445986 [Aspergillus steynii IBT 23096]|uniref:Uncharacterized protein n=1 Tax=Aspergillus steynii IBT 23096 TaxID=1392250 RepID=A0A2I2GCW1_9EURO|nr:uncharacterized protein P170DRAFT_445986 [Aspergillus steynii IBT 23096]PLB50726.1 hypothetical protein P170DRAFT_445986 [Aspergillus steynii IBT 23096]